MAESSEFRTTAQHPSGKWCPSRSILRPILGHIFINDMGSGIESTHRFADNAKLSDAVVSLEGWNASQTVCDRLEDWTHMNTMKFKKDKCKVLLLVWGSPQYQCRLGG